MHRNQQDLGGHPYILHLMRVSLRMYELYGEDMAIAGILHDVIEDTSMTVAELRGVGCPMRALNAIDIVTRHKDYESYREYIERVYLARDRAVIDLKIIDLLDNLNLNRLTPERAYEHRSLFRRDKRALNYLWTGKWE